MRIAADLGECTSALPHPLGHPRSSFSRDKSSERLSSGGDAIKTAPRTKGLCWLSVALT